MSTKVNDTFVAGQLHFNEVLALHAAPEPEYTPPKVWPHQVPVEKRIPRSAA